MIGKPSLIKINVQECELGLDTWVFKGYGRKKWGTRCYIFRLRTLEAHPTSPPPSKKGNYGSICARPGSRGLCVASRTSYFSLRHLRLLPPNLYPTFLHSSKQNQPAVGFSNRPWHDKWYCDSFISRKFQSPRSNSQLKHTQEQQSRNFSFSNIGSASIIFTDIPNAVEVIIQQTTFSRDGSSSLANPRMCEARLSGSILYSGVSWW